MAFEEPKEKYFRGLDLSKLVKKTILLLQTFTAKFVHKPRAE
jgi:hypothetical protein